MLMNWVNVIALETEADNLKKSKVELILLSAQKRE